MGLYGEGMRRVNDAGNRRDTGVWIELAPVGVWCPPQVIKAFPHTCTMARLMLCAAVVAASPVAALAGNILQNNTATLVATNGACGDFPNTRGALPFPMNPMFFTSCQMAT